MVPKELQGELVTLRVLHASFIDAYMQAFSPLVQKQLHCTTPLSELSYISSLVSNQLLPSLFYCMFDSSRDALIGAIHIRNREQTHNQLYSWMHENYWGSGIFQQALLLCANAYFQSTTQAYFHAHVDVENKRSYHALRKCGFAPIGVLPGPFGKQYDMILRKK
jgi:RimJ/RimL family protein N-acetyltransferase